MAAALGIKNFANFVISLVFFLFLTTSLVHGETCPQQFKGSASTNEKASNLAGSGTFIIYDDKKEYKYEINLCKSSEHTIAVRQEEQKKNKTSFNIGLFDGARVFGGTDWLMIEYYGLPYNNHCGNTKRKSIIYITCDRSADTRGERKPKILEEYRPDQSAKDKEFCYYLFEMKHDAVCPPEKTKISPGSVFIIIIAVVGVLYLVLGLLYQRFIVGAKGMEQIPNYLMWREFGTLQADGCNYMCRCQRTREPTRYKPVDDAIADDDDFTAENDNDDAMLPM